jgi:hypothetical protein
MPTAWVMDRIAAHGAGFQGGRSWATKNPHRFAPGVLLATAALVAGCATPSAADIAAARRFADREAIEDVLSRANLGFELSDPDQFANAFATDGVFELAGKGPVFGYDKMTYNGRAEIRAIVADRVAKARNTDPKSLSYDPATLRRFNRNTDSRIEILDATHARHMSTWMVVMHTNVNIHISAVGRYEDEIGKRDGKWYIVKRRRSE